MKRLIAAVSISAFLLTVGTAPAMAAETADGFDRLTDAVAGCGPVALDEDVTGTELSVECDLTLDLNGHTLNLDHIKVEDGYHLTIDDSGTTGELNVSGPSSVNAAIEIEDGAKLTISGGDINANGGHNAAAIGGSDSGEVGHITITGGTITAEGGYNGAGIGGGHGRDGHGGDGGKIIIEGNAVVTATGGNNGAGIGGGIEGTGGEIAIRGNAVVEATSPWSAGIGGGYDGAGGLIDISGKADVTATGGTYGAGIGSAGARPGGTIRISGEAEVTAKGRQDTAGIGGGWGTHPFEGEHGGAGGHVTIVDNAKVTAASGGVRASAVGSGGGSSVFGLLELDATLRVPSGQLRHPQIKIHPNGQLLGAVADQTGSTAIGGSGHIENHGVIALDPDLVNISDDVNIEGHNYLVTFDDATPPIRVFASSFDAGYRDIPPAPASSAWNTEADGSGEWFAKDTELTSDLALYAVAGLPLLTHEIANCSNGDTIALPGDLSGDRLSIGCGLTLDLNGHTLDLNHLKVDDGSHLTITDSGSEGELNVTNPGDSNAAIEVEDGTAFTATGGSITATGGRFGAGIGGGDGFDSGTISIADNADVTASGGINGAGIGGGASGDGGAITITDNATVVATGASGDGASAASGGAGIGGGYRGAGGDIAISGGTVTATGGLSSAGIGGGDNSRGTGGADAGDGGNITITGGTVEAEGSEYGAGIGGGDGGNGGNITITGDANVTVKGGNSGAGIGGGDGGDGGTVFIGGTAVVTATGGNWGAGIGGGRWGAGGDVAITDSANVTATGENYGAGIGGGAYGDAGSVDINSEVPVIAYGGEFSAAIGGGYQAAGGTVTIQEDATVSAIGHDRGTAMGGGPESDEFGSLKLDGQLYVYSGALHNPDITIGEDGQLMGERSGLIFGGTITGTGDIANNGIIGLDATHISDDVTIDGHNYLLQFDTDGSDNVDDIRIYAPNFHVGYRVVPKLEGWGEWNLEQDGTGDVFDYHTVLEADTIVYADRSFDQFATAVSTCSDGDNIMLNGDLNGDILTVNCDLTIDLNEHTLELNHLDVAGTSHLTIEGTYPSEVVVGQPQAGKPAIQLEAGATLTIARDTLVTAIGSDSTSAIGSGSGSPSFGTLIVDGLLSLPAGELHVPSTGSSEPEITIGPYAWLVGAIDDPTQGARITGDGHIHNGAEIALDTAFIDDRLTITGHNYLVTFDPQDGNDPAEVRVFAPSLYYGDRDLSAPPVSSEWNTAADGSGDWFTEYSHLSADTRVFAVTTTELSIIAPGIPAGQSITVDQGDSLTFPVEATDRHGNPVDTSDVVLTSSVETDIIDGLTVTFPTASPHVITASLGSASVSVTVEVVPAAAPDPEPAPEPTFTSSPEPEPTPEPTPTQGATPVDELPRTGTDPAMAVFGIAALLLLAVGGALLAFRRSVLR